MIMIQYILGSLKISLLYIACKIAYLCAILVVFHFLGERWKEVRHDNTVSWLASWIENVQGQVYACTTMNLFIILQ